MVALGIDTGGTFTDITMVRGRSYRIHKIPSTPRNPAEAFLKGMSNPLKDEFYIPSVVHEAVKAGLARVKVLNSNAQWFGVTYREDRPIAHARILELIKAGTYPSPLI